jgi:hypothetical protein
LVRVGLFDAYREWGGGVSKALEDHGIPARGVIVDWTTTGVMDGDIALRRPVVEFTVDVSLDHEAAYRATSAPSTACARTPSWRCASTPTTATTSGSS